jgi:predicted GNAT family N-acyltransferase
VTDNVNLKFLQLSWADAQVLAKPIRISVFIEEQDVPESEEWDDEDSSAFHIIAMQNKKAVATARLTRNGKIGRMSVLKQFRKQGIGSMMLLELIKTAHQFGLKEITLWSQTHAQAFYKKHGFISYGDEFLDAGIAHIKMKLKS